MKQKKNKSIFFLVSLILFFFPHVSNASSSSTIFIEEISNKASEVLSSDVTNEKKNFSIKRDWKKCCRYRWNRTLYFR